MNENRHAGARGTFDGDDLPIAAVVLPLHAATREARGS